MAPYMRIRAVLFAFCLAPTTLCNASPAATSPSPDACQIIPMDQIRGLLAATTETINPMSSQLQPDHSRCTYTLIMKDIDDKVTTNRLTVDYLRFPTPGQAIRAQHTMAHVGWTNNDGSMPLDIPTTSAVNDDEVVRLYDLPPPLPAGAAEPYLGYALRHQGNVVSIVLSEGLKHEPKDWYQRVETAALAAAGATVINSQTYARLHDVCRNISPDEIQTLVTLDIAVTTAEPSTPDKLTLGCDFNVRTGIKEKENDVTVQVTHYATDEDAQFGFRYPIEKDRAKYGTLVPTNDSTDRVLTDSADHTQRELKVSAIHGASVAVVTISSWQHEAFVHPSFEYRLERLALQAAGATIQPSAGIAQDPVAQKPTLGFKIEKEFRSLLRYGPALFGPGVMVLVFGGLALSRHRRQKLLATGLPGTARIHHIADTGSSVNRQPVIRFSCTVTPQDGSSPYEAVIRQAASRLMAPASLLGRTLEVRIDRKNSQRVVFVNINQIID